MSRRSLVYRRFDDLASQLSLELNANEAVLDGEIVRLDESGRPIFLDLIRRRGPFCFVAFDLLAVNGRDLRMLPLTERKRILCGILSNASRCVLYAKHAPRRARALRRGVRAGSRGNRSQVEGRTLQPTALPLSWIKVKNPDYPGARPARAVRAAARIQRRVARPRAASPIRSKV